MWNGNCKNHSAVGPPHWGIRDCGGSLDFLSEFSSLTACASHCQRTEKPTAAAGAARAEGGQVPGDRAGPGGNDMPPAGARPAQEDPVTAADGSLPPGEAARGLDDPMTARDTPQSRAARRRRAAGGGSCGSSHCESGAAGAFTPNETSPGAPGVPGGPGVSGGGLGGLTFVVPGSASLPSIRFRRPRPSSVLLLNQSFSPHHTHTANARSV